MKTRNARFLSLSCIFACSFCLLNVLAFHGGVYVNRSSFRVRSLRVRSAQDKSEPSDDEQILIADKETSNSLLSNIEKDVLQMKFKRKSSSVIGATALIGGTTVGAGVLALPTATINSGFLPSSVLLVLVWVYMCCTGLLIAEVNINLICRDGQSGIGLLTLVERTLGTLGATLSGIVYVFIHYALLVAYIAKGGEILGNITGSEHSWLGPVLFTGIFGGALTVGSNRGVEIMNNSLTVIVLVSFCLLLFSVSGGMNFEYFKHSDWKSVIEAAPIMLVALVFHNVIPVITTQLEGDVNKIRTAIIGGSAIPLIMFLAWNAVILGSIDPNLGIDAKINDPLQLISTGGPNLKQIVDIFSETAIITSFIGFVVGLMDFYTDLFSVKIGDKKAEIPLYFLIFGPALVGALVNPTIFYNALDLTGTFGISLLFGILPALMAWKQRYTEKELITALPLVPGGKFSLLVIAGSAVAIILRSV